MVYNQPTNQPEPSLDESVEQKAREAVAIAQVLSQDTIDIYIDGQKQEVSSWKIKPWVKCYKEIRCWNLETYYVKDEQADLNYNGELSVSEMAIAKYNSNPSQTVPELKANLRREFMQRLFAENRFQANREMEPPFFLTGTIGTVAHWAAFSLAVYMTACDKNAVTPDKTMPKLDYPSRLW